LWQDDLPQDVVMLRRIKVHMEQRLSRVPNYTCLETITRSTRASERYVVAVPGKPVPFRRKDVMRLEVAEVEGVELYADAGAHYFEKKDILDFRRGGLMGNGTFTTFAHDIFLTSIPVFRYAGEEQVKGRPLLRWEFSIPQFMSKFNVGTDLGRAEIGFHGSFWADPQTLDAVRIDITGDDIPSYTGLSGTWDRVEYASSIIGGREVLLPLSGEIRTRDLRGWENSNELTFTHCREYGVQSVIKYDDPDKPSEGGPGGTKYIDLPAGLQLTLTLETPFDAAAAHVGDPVAARVEADVKHKNTVIVPKDAVVTGRVRRLEFHSEGWPYVLLGIELIQMEFGGKQARFFAELEKVTLPADAAGPKRVVNRDLPGVGMISANGNQLRLPVGAQLVWKTTSLEQMGK
jgi:hypothetical protein